MANELSIHRYDAQTASGTATPLDAAVALDAIDEIFVMLPVWENPPEGSGKRLTLRPADGDPSRSPSDRRAQDRHRAPARRPHLTAPRRTSRSLLFERPPIGAVQREGDPAVLDRWYREFSASTDLRRPAEQGHELRGR